MIEIQVLEKGAINKLITCVLRSYVILLLIVPCERFHVLKAGIFEPERMPYCFGRSISSQPRRQPFAELFLGFSKSSGLYI